jgi:hypothetical protein
MRFEWCFGTNTRHEADIAGSVERAVHQQRPPGLRARLQSPGLTRPGLIGPGAYTTQWFFGGRMRISLQGTWTSEEDSTGEFNASPTATPKNAVFVWEDVYPVRGGSPVNGVPPTASGLLHWLQSARALKTAAPRQGRIGTLPATVVDVSVNKRTKNEDPNCPDRPCVLFLSFPQWTEDWGIAGSQVQRFYLADVTYGGDQLSPSMAFGQRAHEGVAVGTSPRTGRMTVGGRAVPRGITANSSHLTLCRKAC